MTEKNIRNRTRARTWGLGTVVIGVVLSTLVPASAGAAGQMVYIAQVGDTDLVEVLAGADALMGYVPVSDGTVGLDSDSDGEGGSEPKVETRCNYGDAWADAWGVGQYRYVRTAVEGRTSGSAYNEYGHTHAETHGWAGVGEAEAVAGPKSVYCN